METVWAKTVSTMIFDEQVRCFEHLYGMYSKFSQKRMDDQAAGTVKGIFDEVERTETIILHRQIDVIRIFKNAVNAPTENSGIFCK